LQQFLNLRFLDCDEANILAYAKVSADPPNVVVVVVNLDPHTAREGEVVLPLAALGLTDEDEFELAEAFTGTVSRRRGARQLFRLDPEVNPSLIFRLLAAQRA
jgi:starch synthase (maltosyl-transferring)